MAGPLAPTRHGEPARLHRDRLTWWSYAVLASFAFLLNGFGPVLLDVRDELGISRTVTGLHSTGVALGMLLAGVVGERLRVARGWPGVLRLGVAGLAAGVLAMALAPSVALSLPATVLIGWAGTLLLTMVPGVLVARHGSASGAAVSEAHASASLLGVLAPLAVGGSLALSGQWWPAFGAIVFVALPLLALRRPAFPSSAAADAAADARAAGTAARLPRAYWRWWTALLFGVAVEFSILLWAADDAEQRLGLSEAAAAVAPAAFLLGMATVRGLGATLLLGRHAPRVFAGAALWGIVGFLVYRASDAVAVAFLGIYLTGTGVGALYPSSLQRAMAAAPGREALASTRSALASGLAIGLGPLALGALADAYGIEDASWIVLGLLAGAVLAAGRPGERERRDAT
jgi:predicted MFS family arabinose efflux permease